MVTQIDARVRNNPCYLNCSMHLNTFFFISAICSVYHLIYVLWLKPGSMMALGTKLSDTSRRTHPTKKVILFFDITHENNNVEGTGFYWIRIQVLCCPLTTE